MSNKSVYQKRRADLATWMAQNSIGLVIIEDSETHRDPALRYFSGHPSDGVLGISITGDAILSPWDEALAAQKADVDVMIPFTRFDRSAVHAAAGIASICQVPPNTRIEISARTPYPTFLKYVEIFCKNDVLCRENGVNQQIKKMRAVKDETEIATIRKACALTDEVIETRQDIFSNIFNSLNIAGRVMVFEGDDAYEVKVSGDDKVASLIGYRGEGLNAYQVIINSFLSLRNKSKKILIDVENYRNKREESLKALAQRIAKKVVKTKRRHKFEPMSAYERHVIHEELANFNGVSTHSEGVEPRRCLIVEYTENKDN